MVRGRTGGWKIYSTNVRHGRYFNSPTRSFFNCMYTIAADCVRCRKMDNIGRSIDEETYDNKKLFSWPEIWLSPNGSIRIAAKVGKKTNVAKCSFRNYLWETPLCSLNELFQPVHSPWWTLVQLWYLIIKLDGKNKLILFPYLVRSLETFFPSAELILNPVDPASYVFTGKL